MSHYESVFILNPALYEDQVKDAIKKYEKLSSGESPLYFLDGVHPQHNSKPAYGWFKKNTRQCSK